MLVGCWPGATRSFAALVEEELGRAVLVAQRDGVPTRLRTSDDRATTMKSEQEHSGVARDREGTVGLRRARPEDAELVLSWREEPSARRYQPLRQLPLERLREVLGERAARPISPEMTGDVQWLIETPAGPVGWVTLTIESREHGLGSVGYTVGERFRGRGYATAGLRALIPIAFGAQAADLWRLEAVAAVDNAASRRVLERAGFVCEGIARAYLVIGSIRVDHARYALLRTDWRSAQDAAPASEGSTVPH